MNLIILSENPFYHPLLDLLSSFAKCLACSNELLQFEKDIHSLFKFATNQISL